VAHDPGTAGAGVARLPAVPGHYAAEAENLTRGIASGFTQRRRTAAAEPALPPRRGIGTRRGEPAAQADRDAAGVQPADEPARLRGLALATLEERVKPAQRWLIAFLAPQYLPKTRAALAVMSLPGGGDHYALLVRRSTTTMRAPETIFALGERADALLPRTFSTLPRLTSRSGQNLPELEALERLRASRPRQGRYRPQSARLGLLRRLAVPTAGVVLQRVPPPPPSRSRARRRGAPCPAAGVATT
jgi:uncharacterized protein (DUF885 family)